MAKNYNILVSFNDETIIDDYLTSVTCELKEELKKELKRREQDLADYERLADTWNPSLKDYKKQVELMKQSIERIKKQLKK